MFGQALKRVLSINSKKSSKTARLLCIGLLIFMSNILTDLYSLKASLPRINLEDGMGFSGIRAQGAILKRRGLKSLELGSTESFGRASCEESSHFTRTKTQEIITKAESRRSLGFEVESSPLSKQLGPPFATAEKTLTTAADKISESHQTVEATVTRENEPDAKINIPMPSSDGLSIKSLPKNRAQAQWKKVGLAFRAKNAISKFKTNAINYLDLGVEKLYENFPNVDTTAECISELADFVSEVSEIKGSMDALFKIKETGEQRAPRA
ncbi:expressed protein [Phakopsora pachyrhizi]|uniref:Expressed protein n=1 Tax=Phakopsora pachyrhizi TaxID=170000 RepID=A0AAV0B9G8_PHAPC|nr:expressed protein [Phakopsora pachyrhizi]